MENFLDTSIIIGYADEEEKFVNFISNNKELIICYFTIERDIFSLKKRFRIIAEEAKKQNPDFKKLVEQKELYKQDLFRAEKFLAIKERAIQKDLDFNNLIDDFLDNLEMRIDFFIHNLVKKIVIPIRDIDFKLKSSLFTFTQNHSDACILASGIQYCQKHGAVLVTSDKKEWTRDNLEWALQEHSLLRKEYPLLPKIKYIQNI